MPALALTNTLLPGTWQALLTPDPAARPIRIIVAWSRSLDDIPGNRAWVFSLLDRILSGILARAVQGSARPSSSAAAHVAPTAWAKPMHLIGR